MNYVPTVVTSAWVSACMEADAVIGMSPESLESLECCARVIMADVYWSLDGTKFLLRDKEAEKKLGFSLSGALERARTVKETGGLFKDCRFIVVSDPINYAYRHFLTTRLEWMCRLLASKVCLTLYAMWSLAPKGL